MFFYLNYNRAGKPAPVQQERISAKSAAKGKPNILYLQEGHQRLLVLPAPAGELILLGDPVFHENDQAIATLFLGDTIRTDKLYETIRGHYYWFLLAKDGFQCGGSFGAIFPVYYTISEQQVLLSSSAKFLAQKSGIQTLNRRNLLERLLFNYPVFDSSWWEGIQLLDAHSAFQIKDNCIETDRSFRLQNYFGDGADQSRDSLNHLAELFEAETEMFLPDAPFGISFTGGFDGRTLLAAARRAGRKNFLTYSFGRAEDADVRFPRQQARQLGVLYRPVLLDDNYVSQAALQSANSFMELTEYNGNFGRPHYHYAAQQLSSELEYLITGNFGSELFRALHQPGVMMSENLIHVFSSPDDSWKDHLRRPQQHWNSGFFKEETDALIADFERYLAPIQGWDANHRFYYFVFQEIFRKYFGPELVMQSHFLNNRTPFLSLQFFSELNKTMWAGVHARLFEKMKNKRLKGQMFYASFIRRVDPQMYRMKTSKGYSPADVLESWRLPWLVGGVVLQKFIQKPEYDTNAVEAFFKHHRQQIFKQINPQGDADLIQAGLGDTLINPDCNLEETIKYYSIAAGWSAAQKADSGNSEDYPHTFKSLLTQAR